MIEISTTATFDKLFIDLPKTIQLKAVKRTELFKVNRGHRTLKQLCPPRRSRDLCHSYIGISVILVK